MKRILLATFVLTLSSLSFAQEKIVIIDNDDKEQGTEVITRSVPLLDYLQVINNELYVCSDNNVDGTCYYNVYKDGNVVMGGRVVVSAYGRCSIDVKSLPIGSYTIEIETPSNFISKTMIIM